MQFGHGTIDFQCLRKIRSLPIPPAIDSDGEIGVGKRAATRQGWFGFAKRGQLQQGERFGVGFRAKEEIDLRPRDKDRPPFLNFGKALFLKLGKEGDDIFVPAEILRTKMPTCLRGALSREVFGTFP